MKREDLLASCIDDVRSGRSTVQDCLDKYPHLRADLEPLLSIATRIRTGRAVPSAGFRQALRNQLLQLPEVKRREGWRFDWSDRLAPVRRLGLSMVMTVLIFLVVAAGGSTVYAAQKSLPDDALYPLKKSAEKLQMALTVNPEDRSRLNARLAERRVNEVVAQVNLGRNPSSAALQAIATQLDEAIAESGKAGVEAIGPLLSDLLRSSLRQQVALVQVTGRVSDDVALQRAIDAARRGVMIARIARSSPSFLATSPSVLDEKLEQTQVKLEGSVIKVDGGNWNVGGVTVRNVASASPAPLVGAQVTIQALTSASTTFVWKIEPQQKPEGKPASEDIPIKISGTFSGTSEDGITWYVSSIPVVLPFKMPAPPEGSHLDVEGKVKDAAVSIVEAMIVESKVDREVEVSGSLVEVTQTGNAIAINVDGANIPIKMEGSPIKNKEGHEMALLELKPYVGQPDGVQASGLYMKEGRIYAREITVDTDKKGESRRDKDGDEKEGRSNRTLEKEDTGKKKSENAEPSNTSGKKNDSKDDNDDEPEEND